ncbi:MAG: DMT family transporter [Patescibacteria group bacterium]
MNWFFIALLSTLCFSTISHIDKYLISRYLRHSGVGALMLFSALFGAVVLPVIFLINKNVFSLSLSSALWLVTVGILSFLAIFFYFKALTYADASTAIPFFQLIPVFGFGLGFIFLRETIPWQSIIAGLVIIIGVLILSFEKKSGQPIIFKRQMVWLMAGSSFTYALYEIIFKIIAIQETFWASLFWQNVGLLLAGLFLYFFITSYRQDFHNLLRDNWSRVIGLNLINEVLNTVAVSLIQYASLLAPIVLVLMVNSLQPVLVFLIGILLTLFLPKISKENLTKQTLLQKSIAITIVLVGSYFLYF